MMKLSIMKALIRTLDPQGSCPTAEKILARWAFEPGSSRFIRASSNFVFAFRGGGRQRVLRFVDTGERPLSAIQAEVDTLEYLSALGLAVNSPVRSLAGRAVETIEAQTGVYHAVVFEMLAGESFEDLAAMPPENLSTWGKTLGELHNALEGYFVPRRMRWQEKLEWAERALPASETAARRALDTLSTALARLPVTRQNFGLIHFDFESDNLIWSGERPGMIDFDDSCYCWFAADIAYALRELFNDHANAVDLSAPVFLSFMCGYRAARAIDDEELARIPLFLLLQNLLKFAELREIAAEGIAPDEPAWTAQLRQKLTHKADSYRTELARWGSQSA